MKPILQIFTVLCCLWLLALSGCGDPDRNRIVGDWEIATSDRLMGQVNPTPLDSPAANGLPDSTNDLAGAEKPRMLIRFYYSGSLATQTNMGNVSTQKYGYWKFLSYDPETRTATIQCKLVDDTTDFEVIVEDENTLRLVPPNMAGLKKKMKFVRQE